jgi:transcriptional regulator with XRE-family HTH domain
MTEGGSVVVRRQLGRELRAWRERARRTLDDVATAQVASVSKVQRIEHGRTSVRPGDVRELCRLYGVAEETTETLVGLARASRDPDWWERQDAPAPAWFALYLRLEAVASELLTYEPTVIHGLFQTRCYAEQVERLTEFDATEERIQGYVQMRRERQRHVFGRSIPMRIRLVLGEAALLTAAGMADVMTAQRAHLRELAAGEHIDVRVLRFAAGLHPSMRGAFSVLTFPDRDDPPVAYVETYDAARYPESRSQVARYRRRFERVWELSVPIEEYAP